MKIYPVIHVHDVDVHREVDIARRHDVAGVFLIDHDEDDARLLKAVAAVTYAHPDFFVGVNVMRRPLAAAIGVLEGMFGDELPVSAIWTDFIDIDGPPAPKHWRGLHFGGVAFKHQPPVVLADLPEVGAAARNRVDVATTSGEGTGKAADPVRLRALREGLAGRPLALASGVTPDNIVDYHGLVDHILVASGIAGPSGIDENELARLMASVA
ncbi:hypothetical protein CH260_15695 [Rhodococcus sp. 05-2256-B2]|uniref:hypothetical protein n=1 Tax=Nocardiaceae TaxID=85025 RepID=UPI00050CE8DA|nr:MULTISPECIES: hypothetical protein [Rhodococcus]MBY4383770.1 hypothetical protein [Rhodococcus fascians]MBY4398981.1 hypothetical protein [Rhodococcus fascians]MBY4408519.1 hypothetical protein [Rhodococcus fascians]MBY4423558.1 hypothetical protein [Rhodococcus fascians]MBY4462918.1 hypothetical protein [Rhodococcus fascians]